MTANNMKKMRELSSNDLGQIYGGNWISELGKSAHEAWNAVQEWWCQTDFDVDRGDDSAVTGARPTHFT